MLVRYLVCGVLFGVAAAVPAAATLDQALLPAFKRLSHPLPNLPADPAPLEPVLERADSTLFLAAATDTVLPKTRLGTVATLTQLSVTRDGVHLSAGAVRNPTQIDHEIDAALSQLRLDPKANQFGQNRTAFVGLGYGFGGGVEDEFRIEFAAGARLVDKSFRGRLNYSGNAWRGSIMDRYEVEPSVNLGLNYRF